MADEGAEGTLEKRGTPGEEASKDVFQAAGSAVAEMSALVERWRRGGGMQAAAAGSACTALQQVGIDVNIWR